MERLAQRYRAVVNFVAVCVNGLVAYPPAGHREADQRGKGWPRLKAAELAERVGLRTVVHAYIDVTDKGENLVCKLGLQTVPTHVLVDPSGQLVSVLARKQLPNGPAVEALVANADVNRGDDGPELRFGPACPSIALRTPSGDGIGAL